MKIAIVALFLLIVTSLSAQTLTDIAAAQNISMIQSAANHWANGASFYDFNEDGWDDLTLPTNSDSIAFFRNNNGNFTPLPSLYAPGQVRQISWVDFDNDGELDLFVSFFNVGVRLYKNTGGFTFIDHTVAAGIDPSPFKAYGFAFGDPDSDGDLDVYISSYEAVGYVPSPTPNRYYENQGNGTFIDKASAYGIDNGLQITFMPVWFDYNNDNLLDLHVINDRQLTSDAMYRNDGMNSYSELAVPLGIDNAGHQPMTISVSDFDNDGYQDVFKTDIANGFTITNGVPVDYKLYKNNAGTGFTNVAAAMNIPVNSFAWGALWVDYNNDCYEDLYVATAFIDTLLNADQTSLFYRNNQGLNFEQIGDSINGDIVCSSYCPIKGDINNDGFYDLFVLNDNVAPNVLLNSGNANNYIRITAVGTTSNRQAIGSVIKVFANNTCQTQTVFCGSGICAQNTQHLIFGTGSATLVDSVWITFPSGIVTKKYNLAVNEDYEIKEIVTAYVDIVSGVNQIQSCLGDTIQLSALGYVNYEWSTGSHASSISVHSTGLYSFQAENMTGDTVFQSNALFVNFNAPLLYQEIIVNVPCGNANVGSAEIVVNQSQFVDSIFWSNGELGSLNDSLNPGTYVYSITSVFGCVQTDSVTLVATPPFSTQYLTTPATDVSGGSIQFFTWGGVAPFTFVLDTTTYSSLISDLAPGTYQVIVTDASGCSYTVEFVIDDQTTAGFSDLSDGSYRVYFADQQLFVCSLAESIQAEGISVYDMMGTEVLNSNWDQKNAQCVSHYCNLPKGIYQVRIESASAVVSKTLVIY